MKKRLCLSTAALTLLSPFAAFADDPTGPTVWDGFSGFLAPDWSRDFSATVGVKIWISDWQRSRTFVESGVEVPGLVLTQAIDSSPDSFESDIEAVPIPQISARYKWLFVTGSYYAKTNFDFDFATSRIIAGIGGDVEGGFDAVVDNLNTLSQSADRYEWDASAGVYIHPYVALLGGYKKVRQQIDITSNFAARLDQFGEAPIEVEQTFTSSSDVDIEGPTIGIAGSVPIGRGFGMYASYAHGFMDTKLRDVQRSPIDQEVQSGEFDATYDVAELGFSYTHGMEALAAHMPLSAATVYAGYRYQHISTEFDEPSQDASDTTKGFAVGLNLTF